MIEDADEALHRRLQASADAHCRSVGDEARELLREAVARQSEPEHLVDLARRLFGPEHGFDLDIPPRSGDLGRPPPDFDETDDPADTPR